MSAIEEIDDDTQLEGIMIDLFDQFGIAVEELGDHCYYIKPDTVFAGDAFQHEEIGMSITLTERLQCLTNK